MTGQQAYKDRRTLLIISGVILLLIGAGIILLGLLGLIPLLPLPPEMLGAIALPDTQPGAIIAQVLMHVIIGAFIATLGVGSIRARRWVPVLAVSLGWIWLIAGMLMLVTLGAALPSVWSDAGLTVSETMKWIASAIILMFSASVMVVAPFAIILIYRSPNVESTCKSRSPEPAWTDRCPSSVMPVPMSFAILALMLLCMAAFGMLPVFHFILTGWVGTTANVLLAAILTWLAVASVQLKSWSWWATLGGLSLMTVSLLVTLTKFDLFELYAAMGVNQMREMVGESTATRVSQVMIATVIALQIIGTIYLIKIKPFFAESNLSHSPAPEDQSLENGETPAKDEAIIR